MVMSVLRRKGPVQGYSLRMKVDEIVWKKWMQWVSLIQLNLQNSVNDLAQFDVFREVVAQNADWIRSNNGSEFVYLVTRSFSSHAFMSIRRQVKIKRNDDAVSLVRLLTEVANQAHQLTYQLYLRFNPRDPAIHEWQVDAFGKLSEDRLVVSRELIQRDLDRAKQLSANAEEIADKQVAHLDFKGTEAKATFDELRDCLYHFDKLTVKYIRFFTGISHVDETLKVRLPFDPREIFRHPLIKSG